MIPVCTKERGKVETTYTMEEDDSTHLLRQFAFEKGIRVFRGVTELFQKPEKPLNFDFSPDETVFTVNPSIGNVKRIRTLDPLKRLGYTIISADIKKPWFPGQQSEYKLAPYRPGLLHQLDRIPTISSHGQGRITVELDSTGRIRLVGRNAGPNMYGPWIQTKTKPSVVTNRRTLDVTDYLSRREDVIQDTIRELSKNINEEENIFIPSDEIPVMITEENELLCIKLEKDIVHVGFVGKSGMGKTLAAHAFIDRVFWRTDNKIAILNDSVNQCFTWRRPDTTPAWANTLNRYNETPRGLPVAIFVPNHKNVVDIPFENEMAFRETISWEWLVQNWKTFLAGSPWELGQTEKYFTRYKKEFLQMFKLEELQDYFYDKAKSKDIQPNSADKINATLGDMWAKEFIDRSTKIASKWNFQTKEEHYEEDPFVGCLRAGLVPVLNTVNLKDQHYHPQYTKYKIDQVKHYQLSIPTNKRKKMWLFIDEIGDIYKKGNEKTVAGRKLVETVTQGRNFQLGCLYTIQNYTQIDPEIRNNTGYFFCFTTSSIEEGRSIAKNLGFEKTIGDSLTTMPKGQCIAISNDREWVIYTPYGERYRMTGAFKGDPLPPLSMHYRPGDEI